MQNVIVLTSDQRDTALGLDSAVAEISPRAFNGESLGAAWNLNAAASGVALGEAVTLTGKYILPVGILTDPRYQTYCPNLLTALQAHPQVSIEPLTVFAPSADSDVFEGFPSDANFVNVRDHGATGDGVTDDTAAIMLAIDALPVYSTATNVICRPLYFPAGTYLISDTIERFIGASPRANFVLIGENKRTTRIKLADAATGYTSAGSAKAMLALHSGNLYGQSPNEAGGEGNEAFNNSVENITFDPGTGNPGAVCIDAVQNNISVIRNVDCIARDAAHTGIAMTRRYPGPCLTSNVRIIGPFLNGIDVGRAEYSMVFEHIWIDGATQFGFRNQQNNPNIRNLNIRVNGGVGLANTDPVGALVNTPWGPNEGLIVLVDCVITGRGTAALSAPNGFRNFKNVVSQNFIVGGVPTSASFDGVYQQATLLGQPDWELPVKETPFPPGAAASSWTKITAPVSPTDSTATLQAAFADTNAKVVYLPNGIYRLNGPITVADNIERIEGLYSIFELIWAVPQSVFVVNPTRTKDLFIRRVQVKNSPNGMQSAITWNVPSRCVMTDYHGATAFRRTSAGGEFFGENINCTHFFVEGGTAGCWVRQANPEVTTVKVTNKDAPMWILGYKTEQVSIQLANDGGNVEILGGLHYPGASSGVPMWTNTNNGRISAAYVQDQLSGGLGWTQEMTSTINGVANTILTNTMAARGPFGGRNVPKLSTDEFVNAIQYTLPGGILASSSVGTVAFTASLTNTYAQSGTPVWSLTNDAGGKFAINPSTGAITVAAALTEGLEQITIAVSGLTFGASGGTAVASRTAELNISNNWNPSFLGPVFWFDAAQSDLFQSNAGTTAATTNGHVVGYGEDLSGFGNHLLSVADDTTRPTLQGVGGNRALRFDGTNDLLRTLTNLGLYAAGACTVGVAVKSNSPVASSRLVTESHTGNNPWYTQFAAETVTTRSSALMRNDASTAILSGTTTPGLVGAFPGTDVALTFTDTGSVVSHYLDKGTPATASYTRSGALTTSRLCVGGLLRSTPSNWFAGDVYGIVAVKRVLNIEERELLATYLGGLQGRSI